MLRIITAWIRPIGLRDLIQCSWRCGRASWDRSRRGRKRRTRNQVRRKAASTRLALAAGHLLIEYDERQVEGRRGHLAMGDAIRDDFNGEALRIADGLLACGSVTHHSRYFEDFGDPAVVIFALEFDGKCHYPVIPRCVPRSEWRLQSTRRRIT